MVDKLSGQVELIEVSSRRGRSATIAIGTITTGAAGTSASVTNVGTSGEAVFNFTIPRGDAVELRISEGYFQWKNTTASTWNNIYAISDITATIEVGTVTTGDADSSVTFTNAGSGKDAIFNLSIPKGTTFTPSVSAEGVISFTNDGGLSNPAQVDIKGDNSYIHIKWHTEGSQTLLDVADDYIGIYVDHTPADSEVYADYTWFKYKGDPGNLTGPATSTDGNVPIFDGVGGDLLKDSGVKLSDKADVTDVANALALKADTSDFNTLDQTVDTLIPVIANTQSRISAQEALMTGYNPTGADRVDLSSTAQEITLPANVAEGGLNVLQGGMSLKNEFTGKTLTATTLTNDVYTLNRGTYDNLNTISSSGQLIPPNTKCYVRLEILENTASSKFNFVMVGLSTIWTGPDVTVNSGFVGIIDFITTTKTSYDANVLYNVWFAGVSSAGAYVKMKILIVQLSTEMSLYTKEQMAVVIPAHFDGTKSATATRIKVVDADDERPTYQYVEPLPLRRLPDGTRDTIENGTHIQRVSDDGTTALATPITTYGVATGVPIAYPNGTITLEPVLADVGYYTDKFEIARTGYPIVSLETLSMVDISTGQLSPLDVATAVIAGDGLSFTHAGLTAGDLVDVTYFWDYNGVYGENTFGYLDSEVVKADTHNGKFYKAVPSFTDGVLTWTVEEVV